MITASAADFRLALPEGGRLLGMDVGTKTIGLALSDTTLTVASPLDTIRRTRFRDDVARLAGLCPELDLELWPNFADVEPIAPAAVSGAAAS
jgi:hypothetical protein